MKRFYYFLPAAFSLIVVVLGMAFVNAKRAAPQKHLEIVLRNIGHQLLLHSKDSASRVLPVTTVNAHTFQISFENAFGFTPDTLMRLVQQQLAKTDMPKDYTVSVNNCYNNQTIFAYEINSSNGDIKPCAGRVQQPGCYVIEIEFLAAKSFNYTWLLTAIVPLAFLVLYLNSRRNKQIVSPGEIKEDTVEVPVTDNDHIVAQVLDYKQLGNFIFHETNGTLSFNNETIELSDNEIKAVRIFASNQNKVVGRDLLKKEIWENEGVFVISRSVDVLISKLRKKLQSDPSVKIVNVHGKGYKFVTV